jgi:hypothetical protein
MSDVLINPTYTPAIGDWFNPKQWTWAQAHPWICKVETCGIPFNKADFTKAQTFNHVILIDPCNTVRRLSKEDCGKYAKREITQEIALFAP